MTRHVLAACAALALAPSLARAGAPGPLVVLAPHPDDAEASCGGLMANAAAAGQPVIVVAMTAGEIGIGGKTQEEARAVRTAEAQAAAAALGARLELFGAIDGALVADAAGVERLRALLARLAPAIVLAPWPLDVHADHQATGLLAWRTFHDRRAAFDLFFYETANAPHTTSFRFAPTHWVDVTAVLEAKRQATYRHASQGPAEWFEAYVTLARMRGLEADVPYAEGYVEARSSSGLGGRAGRTGATLPATDRTGPGAARVVFLGDSITEGWPRAAPGFFEGRPWLARGVGGETTRQILARFRRDVLEPAPQVVVILAGTNDVAGNGGPYREEATVANVAAMVELARGRGIRVVLASVLPVADYPWRPGRAPAPKIAALNARLRALAKEQGLTWLDYHAAMSDGRGGLRPELTRDGVHPERAGYEVMGPLAEAAVREALGR